MDDNKQVHEQENILLENRSSSVDNTPKKSRKMLYIIFVVLGCVLLSIIVALFVGKFAGKKQPTVAKVSPNVTPTVSVAFKSVDADINAIHAQVNLAYIYDPRDSKTLVLRQVDFEKNRVKETVLPYFWENSSDPQTHGEYKISPDEKYILRKTLKKFEVAKLSDAPNLKFILALEAPQLLAPTNYTGGMSGADFSYVGDAMWDDKGNLYMTAVVGLDGMANPYGIYTDLYMANADGTSKRLLNDHTKENQNYGFMKKFYAIDSAKNEIYLSGETHASHIATMFVISSANGDITKKLEDIHTDISDPIFNKDFSKAYFLNDYTGEGYGYATKIYEYDMNTKAKKLLYTVPQATDSMSYEGPLIDRSPISLHIDNLTDTLYFEVAKNLYSLALTGGGQPKQLLQSSTDKSYCERIGMSQLSDYIFSRCWSKDTESNTYIFTHIPTNKEYNFIRTEKIQNETEARIKILKFK